VSVDEFKQAEYHWQKLSREDYLFDKTTGTFMVNVAPQEDLLIDQTSNYMGDENQFDLISIKISGANGVIDLQGKQAQTQFKIESDTKYVIRYR
jgi:hypothetical protein